MGFIDNMFDRVGAWIADRLETETSGYQPFTPSDPETLERILQPGDILLIEGNQKISAAIKYLTQSTWSHAAMFIGDRLDELDEKGRLKCLIEVELGDGCIASPLEKYQTYNTRICRPVKLTMADRKTVIDFMVSNLGNKYDARNILDLARYLFPTPPIPVRFRRRMLSLGSGEPTRAICSSLIARAFQKVYYPILPRIERVDGQLKNISPYSRSEILHIRHHSLFVPRDFDLSPFFEVVKPTIERGFDYKSLSWSKENKSDKNETKVEVKEEGENNTTGKVTTKKEAPRNRENT